ncbi:phage tail protein [Lactiplantibacillus plantarum]|uniref:phage tail protein n=1 Tax=Lactiplantibacillus plantarum TaxID=1590 RepID=UPI003CF1DA42
MAESNATQVILTDDGIKIINAQNTAYHAASGVANLNDPNLMSVIEKQTQAAQYAGLTSQYNVVLARAKDASISTTALTTAYTNLNTFMSAILTDTTKASDVNRDTYKSLTDAYNTALSNVQTALSDSFNTDIDNMQSSVAVASQAASSAAISDAKIGNISANHITTGSIDASKVTVAKLDAGNITTGTLSTDRLNVGKLSALSANLGDVTTGSLKGVDIVANTFSTPNGSFTTDANGNVVASNLTIRGVTNLVYNAALLGNSGTYPNTKVPGWNLFTKGYYSNATLHDGVPSIGFNSSTGSGTWVTFAQSKLYPLNGLHGQPYSASVWFIEDGSEAAMKYQFTLAFFDANGNRLASGYAGNTWNGNPISQGWAYKTINNIISPSTAVYVAIQYWAYNGAGHALFSSPMLTQTAQSTGYQPDTGNVVSAGEIDGSVINGSTINGTTFNAGDIISSTYNTSRFYPTTITPAGLVATTGFNSMDGLRTEMSAGSFVTKYRAVHSSSNQYEAYDGVFSGDELALNSGFTNGIDMGFQQSVSGNQLTGQVVLSPLNGIHLWGSTQSIHFSGLQMNGTGITMNSYGNILADQGSTWWRVVDFSGKEIANFGTDVAGSNAIKFNRELDIGNFHINTGHTFTSVDNGAIHFAMGKGGTVDIYAGAVHYTSLVKSSLLSVKQNVQKADTAYWAQLVNSIDLATYQYKTDDNTSHIRLSSIVDDVNDTEQWQLPDVFIARDENGKLSGVDDSVLLNATLATVQEQQKEIDQLNGHNMKLEARLNKLEAKLNG